MTKCMKCGYEWQSKNADHDSKCPKCGEVAVAVNWRAVMPLQVIVSIVGSLVVFSVIYYLFLKPETPEQISCWNKNSRYSVGAKMPGTEGIFERTLTCKSDGTWREF